MHGSVFLDADNQVNPALLWCDCRTADQRDAITRKAGERLPWQIWSPTPPHRVHRAEDTWLRDNEPGI